MPALQDFPPVFGVSELSILLQKSPASILADRVRAAHRIPPSCEPPGSKQPLWILEDVVGWLRQHQRPAAVQTSAQPQAQAAGARRRGRPRKTERIARRQKEGGAA